MKRLLLSLLLLLSVSVMAQTTSNDFFGLRLGQSYTEAQIRNAVEPHGIFDEEKTDQDSVCNNYHFKVVEFCNDLFIDGTFACLIKDNTLKSISLTLVNPYYDNVLYNQVFDRWVTLFKYEMIQNNNIASPNESFVFSNNELMVILYKSLDENGQVQGLGLSYVWRDYLSDITTEQKTRNSSSLIPRINDSFFGIKLGERINQLKTKNAIGRNCTNSSIEIEGYEKYFNYTNVNFAGHVWTHCTFETFLKEFYGFRVDEVFNDDYYGQKEAQTLFDNIKLRLDNKYGSMDTETKYDSDYAGYYGSNDVAIMLRNEVAKSKTGRYYRYVILEYVKLSVYDKSNNLSNRDL